MNFEELTVEEIRTGYRHDPAQDRYQCLVCPAHFAGDEVYPMDGHYLTARRAAQHHLETTHGDYFESLVDSDSRYNPLTQNQRQLLKLIHSGASDKAIAAQLGISAATVRQHRFGFREKAKEARLYLAIYQLAMAAPGTPGEAMVPTHATATMVDERYLTTEKERDLIIKIAFSSQEPLRLVTFPRKEKQKIVVLTRITQEIAAGRHYTEAEVNAILREIFPDFATLRRYLIEYGYLERKADGSAYWLKTQTGEAGSN